ncbi:MAG: hypothetical protein EBR27_12040 [Betaproteobacteria bacterium]|nr:hypothetical protein [Betaproteobacteria bacterium]
MIVNGTGIPSDAVVISKTATSVTLNQNATLSGTYAANYLERIDFDFPPTQDSEEEYRPKQTITESLSGLTQVVTDYLEAFRSVEMGFLSQAVADKLQTNFYLFAYKGNSFRWFPDKAIPGTFQTYELGKWDFSRDRQVKKHPSFLYQVKMTFRRVVQ